LLIGDPQLVMPTALDSAVAFHRATAAILVPNPSAQRDIRRTRVRHKVRTNLSVAS
jgi:hypothetical protein